MKQTYDLTHPGPKVNALLRFFGRTWLKIAGWEIEGDAPKVTKAVFIASPHTSNWDTPFMIATAWAYNLRLSFLVKEAVDRGVFGRFMRWVGGIPVNRFKSNDTVQQVADQFESKDTIYLAIAPAGTRKATEFWRSGFYHIARAANVPVICGFVDYGRKRSGCGPTIHLTGDVGADMDRIRAAYEGMQGRYPEKHSRVRLKSEDREVAAGSTDSGEDIRVRDVSDAAGKSVAAAL